LGVVSPKFLLDSKALKPAASSPNLLGPHPDRILLADHTGSRRQRVFGEIPGGEESGEGMIKTQQNAGLKGQTGLDQLTSK